MKLSLRINHAGAVSRIAPLDGVPPLPKRKDDPRPGSGRRATKERKAKVRDLANNRADPRLPRRGR